MMGRDRRNGRANLKARVGIATAVLVGGGAIGVAAMAAGSHGANSATPAGYSAHYNYRPVNQLSLLGTAMNQWRSSSPWSSYSLLSNFTQQGFNQTWQHRQMVTEQRGIVVLATHKFLILQSANGSLHLWQLSGNTHILNVSNTVMGTAALTGNNSATMAAMTQGNLIPATNILAGSPLLASQMLTPSTVPQTVTVKVANTALTVTVTITNNTAAVSQTATMPMNTSPLWRPSTWTQSARTTAANWSVLARGDLALVVGVRSHWLLHAQIVLFTPLTTGMVGGVSGLGTTPTTPATPTATSAAGNAGTHF